MFDTNVLSQSGTQPPDPTALRRFGATCQGGTGFGDAFQIFINSKENPHEPRITITRRRNGTFVYRSGVSIGAWLFGSNLHLPSVNDIPIFFDAIDDFFGERTGITLDSRNSRTARLDITRDLRARPDTIPAIIDSYRNFDYPKRNTLMINGTTVRFDSKGKKHSLQSVIYSKYHERIAKKADEYELEMSRGILRIEEKFLTNHAVRDLAKKLRLRDHKAKTMLTEDVHFTVMDTLVKKLGVEQTINAAPARLEAMYKELGRTRSAKIMEHLALEHFSGKAYHHNPIYKVGPRTAKALSRDAARYGFISLVIQ